MFYLLNNYKMSLEEILNAIENLEAADLVPVLETVTAKFAENFGYIDSYATPAEEEAVEEVEVPVEEEVEVPVEEEVPAEDVRLSL